MAVTVVAGLASAGGYIASVGLASATLAGFASAFAIGAGLSMVSRALMPKPDLSTQLGGLETTVREPAMARQLIYGRAKVGGNIVYIDNTGDDNKYLHMVIALAGHEIDGYEKVYFNDELAWSSGAGYEPKFASKTRIKFYTGNQTTADSDLVTESLQWQNDCILRDTAYIYVRLEYDTDIFSQGIPNISALVRGKKVLDPRTSTTAWSDNPALCIYDYLRDEKYGLNTQDILLQSVIDSADDCDTQVDYLDGATTRQHAKYRLNGVIDTSQKISTNIENMLTAMAGRVVFSGGSFEVHSGKYVTPTVTLDESVIVGDIQFSTKTSRRSTYNAVKGVFLSKENNYTLADYPAQISSTYQTEDGEPLFLDMTLPFTTDNVRAQRLAKLALLKSRQQRTLIVPVNLTGLKLKAGDTVYINNTKLGLSSAPYEVLDYELTYSGENLVVNLSLVETASGYYDWNTSDQIDFSIANDVALYDGTPVSVTNLTATSGVEIKSDGTSQTYIDVNWDASSDAFVDHYIIEYSNGTDRQSIKSNDTNHRIATFNDNQEYTINVYAVNLVNRKSTATQTTATSSVDTIAPAQPSAFNITGELHQIKLTWSNPTDSDFNRVIIKSNSTNDLETASVLSESYTNYFIDSGHLGVVTRHYWIASIDNTGNESAYAYMGSGTTEKLQTIDFADGVIIPDYLDVNTQGILTSVANYDTDISNISTSITNLDTDIQAVEIDVSTRALQSDFQNITQKLDDNLTTASERLLSMSLFASEQAGVMRDAGITVDPNNGSVSIQAVEQLRTETDAQFTQVGLEIDAIDGQLSLYATRTFVENEIAEAQLDPTEFTAFTDLQARVNQAEIDIDANTASVILKADQTELDSLDVRLSQAEIDIDGAEASIALKANQSDFTDLQTRVTSAEIQLDAIDAPSITQTVVDVSNLTHRMNDAEVQDLTQLLEIYDTRQTLQQDIAFTRTQITADVTDIRESIATQRTELGALIDANSASIISEQTARANADTAITEDITQLRADLTTAEGDITGNASAITSLDGRVTTAEGSITSQATDITNLQSSVTNLETDTTANATAITGLDTRVTSAESSITSQSTDITNLQTGLTTAQGDITTNATAITNLDTRVTSAEGSITSQSTEISTLQSSVTGLETDTSNNATAISGLDTRVTQTESDISTQSTAITNLTTSVNEKVITFSQDAEPTENLTAGDLWIDTDDANKLYRYSGTAWVEVSDNRIADTATALSQLTTTVTQNGTDITAISQDVTQLRTDVDDNTAEIVSVAETASSETRASAKRLEQLVTGQAETQLTEILNRENNQDNLNSEIAIVRSDFNAVTQASQESIAQTRTDLTALINGNSADITSEQLARASADQALASDITSLRADLTTAEGNIQGNADATTLLTARVDTAEGEITSISADVTTLQSELDIAESGIATNAGAISALDTRVTSAEGTITSQATDITTLETGLTDANTSITANATAITGLDTRVTTAENTITSQSTSITSLESSVGDLETAVGVLETDTTANATAITALDTTVTSQGTSITANATAITNLSSTVGDNTTDISTLQTTTNGITAQYSVTVNNNGTVSGFGLVSDIIDGNPTSAFNISADQFSLMPSNIGEVWVNTTDYLQGDIVTYLGRQYEAIRNNSNKLPDNNPEDWEDVTTIPFTVYTTDTQVTKDGETVTIPKGVYIQDAYIQNLAVGTNAIKGGAVSTVKVQDNAISDVASASNASAIALKQAGGDDTYTDIIETTITVADNVKVIVGGQFRPLSTDLDVQARIRRIDTVGTNHATIYWYRGWEYGQTCTFNLIDEPTAGTYKYVIEIANQTSIDKTFTDNFIYALEVKK